MVRLVLLAVLGMPFVFSATSSAQTPLATVPHVDLQKYDGQWLEVARLPNRFERKCARDVMAEYTLAGDTIHVRNTCIQADGKPKTASGKAVVVDTASNAKLKVTFFWPFYGKYWIIGLDPGYRWAVVGEPSRKYLWILSRTAVLSPSDRAEVDRVIADRGYQQASLLWNPVP